MKTDKRPKASVLVVSLMVLSIIVIIALSISLVSIREQKNASGESSSSKAFQSADSGIEFVMNEIIKGGHTLVKELPNCQPFDHVIRRAGYDVALFDATGTKIDCDNISAPISNIARIKSTGSASGQSRAIEAAVASTGPDWDSGWFAEDNASNHMTTKAHNMGVYPSNCMMWFSPTNPPSGKIYPVPCYPQPYAMYYVPPANTQWAYQNPMGFEITDTTIAYSIYIGNPPTEVRNPLYKYWKVSSWDTWNSGFYRILLWK